MAEGADGLEDADAVAEAEVVADGDAVGDSKHEAMDPERGLSLSAGNPYAYATDTESVRFPELSEGAKDKARSWYRGLGPHDDWWDVVYEDFERVCEILGIRLKTRAVRLMGGGTRQRPCVWFSGFCSQGDGASYEGYLLSLIHI